MNLGLGIAAARNFARRNKRAIVEAFAFICMLLAVLGALVDVWKWWPLAVLASMFFVAANIKLLRSFSIGPGGVNAEVRDVAEEAPQEETKKTWKERTQLELYVLANLSVRKAPHSLPVDSDPALSRLRTLKDAARGGALKFQGERPNMFAIVRLDDFERYASSSNNNDFVRLATEWRESHPQTSLAPSIADEKERDHRLRLARLRSTGVRLRNQAVSGAPPTTWQDEVRDWTNEVISQISRIDEADAEWFRTLDAVPPPRVRHLELPQQSAKTFRELDFMLAKVDLLLKKYAELI